MLEVAIVDALIRFVTVYSVYSINKRLITKISFIRGGGLMVSALVSGSSGPGSSPGQGHCVVFLGKTLNSHSASRYFVVCPLRCRCPNHERFARKITLFP